MLYKKIEVWPEGMYQSEMKDGFKPTMDTYILEGSKKRPAVLICPGGGYAFTSEREAEPIAMQFNAAGFNAFILYYSVAPRVFPQPQFDVSRAMCIIRENAKEWNINEDRIAVCGFSAGGHLAASLGVLWDDSFLDNVYGITKGLNRPNAMILCYPVITSGVYAHRGSINNLLGKCNDALLLEKMSLEKQVSQKTPPTFLWHTYNDGAVPVENSMLFAQALREKNIEFELHIYREGPHGLSLATSETASPGMGVYLHVSEWMKLCIQWLKEVFEIEVSNIK